MRVIAVRLGAATMALGLVAGVAMAGPIEDRQATMKEIGKSMKALAAMAKGEAAFDAAVVASHGNTIASDLEKVGDMFPDGSQTGDKKTDAKPEIWTDRATFDATRTKAVELAKAVAAVTAEDQLMPALGALGKDGCKACHEKFRKPDED